MDASTPAAVRPSGTSAVAHKPYPRPPDATSNRVLALIVFLVCLAVLSVALWLKPTDDGVGTHEELGLAACDFHKRTGIPCATCGYTTATAWAAHGHLLKAFLVQPAGLFFALATAGLCWVSGWCLVTGASMAPLARRLTRLSVLIAVVALVLLAWGYKILVML